MTHIERPFLVTGAGGFLGGALALRLAAGGARVRALVRSPEKATFLRGQPNIEIVQGDVTDVASIAQAVEGCGVILHAAAAFGSWEQQQAVNVEGTRNVARAAASADVDRLVNVSSIAVYGYRLTADTTEQMPVTAVRNDAYTATKIEAEAVVRDVGAAGALGVCTIRPGMIYGPRSANWTETLFKLARRRPTPFIGSGSGTAHPIFVDDVVDMMIVLAQHPAAAGETFNCTPDPAPTWREFLGAYQRLAGHDRWLAVPPALVEPLAWAVCKIIPVGNPLRDAYDQIRMFQRPITHRTAKARDLLGWQPRIDLATGAARCAPWLRERGLLA